MHERLFKKSVDAIYDAGLFISMGEGNYYIEVEDVVYLDDQEAEEAYQNEVSESIKIFSDVYTMDLEIAIDYYNQHEQDFSEDEKDKFAIEIMKELILMSREFETEEENNIATRIEPAEGTMYPSISNELYDCYSFSTNELNINVFKSSAQDELIKIIDNKYYTIAANIWATDGSISPIGFSVILDPDMYRKSKKIVLRSSEFMETYDLSSMPNVEYEIADSVINSSGFGYTVALLHNIEEAKTFIDKETWKLNLYIPVKFVKKDISSTDNTTNTSKYTDMSTEYDDSNIIYDTSPVNGMYDFKSLKVGQNIDGFIISELVNKVDDELSFTLEGEVIIVGKIIMNEQYMDYEFVSNANMLSYPIKMDQWSVKGPSNASFNQNIIENLTGVQKKYLSDQGFLDVLATITNYSKVIKYGSEGGEHIIIKNIKVITEIDSNYGK